MATPEVITLGEFNNAQLIVARILGAGEGDYGYNQTVTSSQQSSVTVSEVIKLRNDIYLALHHQKGGAAADLLMPTITDTINSTVSEAIRVATIGIPASGSTPAVLGTIDTGRFSIFGGIGAKVSRSILATGQITDQNWNGTSTQTATVVFSNATHMRSYFNAGSTIEILPSKSGVVTTKNTAWASLLNLGTITFQRSGTTSASIPLGTDTTGNGFDKLTTTDSIIFSRSSNTTDEVYTVKARLSGDNTIIFTSTFSNAGVNVSGTLSSTIKSFRPSRELADILNVTSLVVGTPVTIVSLGSTTNSQWNTLAGTSNVSYSVGSSFTTAIAGTGLGTGTVNVSYVSIPAPAVTAPIVAGLPSPTYAITKNPVSSQVSETGKFVSVSFTVTTYNYTGTNIYYRIVKAKDSASDIIEADFVDKPLSGALAINQLTGVSASIDLTANADNTTEGIDKFDIEFRTTENQNDPVVISILKAFNDVPITIIDTSITPKEIPRTIRFASLAAGKTLLSTTEGSKISFGIISTGITAPYDTVTWRIYPVATNPIVITASDFDEGVEGTFTMPSDQNYTLDLHISADKDFTELLEEFQVYLYLTDPVTNAPNKVKDANSYMVQIGADVALVTQGYEVLTPLQLTTVEGDTVGISVPFKTPYLAPSAQKVWYRISTPDSMAAASGADFVDGLSSGYWPVTVIGTSTTGSGFGTLKKYAKSNDGTEGSEGFIVEFFKDSAFSQKFGQTATLTIAENVGYTATRSAPSMIEPLSDGSTAGKVTEITFTLNTPYLPNSPETMVDWEVKKVNSAGGIGIFTTDDFIDGEINGSIAVVDNKAAITLRANNDGITEGVEQFFVRFTYPLGDGTAYKDSPIASITENVKYVIDVAASSSTSMVEALASDSQGVTFDITTPFLPPNTKIYWETVAPAGDKTSKFLPSDFADNATSGVIIINQGGTITNAATLQRIAVIDKEVEGKETFQIILKTGTAKTTEVARSPIITITEDIKAKIDIGSTTTLVEGATGATFKITTPKLPDKTKVYWTINQGNKGKIQNIDFLVSDDKGKSEQRLTGYALTKSNAASFTVAARKDVILNSSDGTEPDETFTISIRIGSETNDVEDTTPEITIKDVSSYAIVADQTMVKESDAVALATSRTVTFTVYTPYMDDSTVLYWTTASSAGIINASDFKDGLVKDTVKVYKNKATIIRTMNDDQTSEGNEKFYIQIREGGYDNPVVKGGVSPGVLINDNSQGLPPPEDPGKPTAVITSLSNSSSFYEGDTINLQIATTNVLTTDDLFWSTFNVLPGGLINDLSKVQSDAAFRVIGSSDPRTYTVPGITVSSDNVDEGSEVFIFQVHKGSVATKPIGYFPITINDQVKYSISTSTISINEAGNTGVTFNIITPDASKNTLLKWTIVPESGASGTGVTGNDFSVASIYNFDSLTMTGTVAIGASNTGSFVVTAATDSTAEVTEKFRIILKKPVNGGAYETISGVQSDVISIFDLTGYTLVPSAVGHNLPSAAYTVPAGTSVTYTLSTPKIATLSNPWKWELLGSNLADMMTTSGSITVNNTDTSYTFTVTTNSDKILDTKKFTVQITDFAGGKKQLSGNPSMTVTALAKTTIVPKVGGTVLASPYSITNTTAITFNVVSTVSPVYWYLAQTTSEETSNPNLIDSDDFLTKQPLAGKLIPSATSKTANFTLTFANRLNRKHGDKKFHIILSATEPSDPIQSTLPDSLVETVTITRTEAAVYSITPNISDPYHINEGTPVTFTVTTPFISSDTFYKWEVVSTGSPAITTVTVNTSSTVTQTSNGALSGTFKVFSSSNSGTFAITVPNDNSDNSRSYKIRVSDLSNSVKIQTTDDTNPTIYVDSNPTWGIEATASATSTTAITSIPEGSPITFTVTPPATNTVKKIQWTAVKNNNSSSFVSSHVTPATGTATAKSDGTFIFSVTATVDNPAESNTNRIFKIALANASDSSPITNVDNLDITITDYLCLSVVDDGIPTTGNPAINEGVSGNVIKFTVTAKPEDVNSVLTYKIFPVGMKNTDFVNVPVSLSGNTDLVSSEKTVDFTVTTVQDFADNKTPKSFYVTFTSTVSPTGSANTCKSRVVSVTDSSKTAAPELYAVEDNGTNPLPSKLLPSINEGGTGSSITFTVTTKTADNGKPLYWRIKYPTAAYVNEKCFSINDQVLTSLSGQTANVSNRTATLTLAAVADLADNKPAKKFYVEFSTAATFPAKIEKGLTSRTVEIADTSVTYHPPATLGLNVTYMPTVVFPGDKFVVQCTIASTTETPLPSSPLLNVSWVINSDKTEISSNVRQQSKSDIQIGGVSMSQTATLKNRTGSTLANSQFCVLPLLAFNNPNFVSNDPCGTFTITFKVIDPSSKNEVTKTTDPIQWNHLLIKEKITKSGPWTIPSDANFVNIRLIGGEGDGGFDTGNPNRTGGYGATGDIVTGTYNVQNILSKSLYFKFLPPSTGGPAKTSGWQILAGNTGGGAAVVYAGMTDKGNAIAVAAGGGAGGNSWADGGSGRNGLAPTSVTSYSSSVDSTEFSVAPTYGNGGAGAPRGTNNTTGIDDDNDSRGPRYGGGGGISFVPAGFSRIAGSAGIAPGDVGATPYAIISYSRVCSGQAIQSFEYIEAGTYKVTVPTGVTSANVVVVGAGGGGGGAGGTDVTIDNTYYTTYPWSNDGSFLYKYGIYGGAGTTTIKALYRTEFSAPKVATDYILTYYGNDAGYVKLGGVTHSFSSSTWAIVSKTITLTKNFDRKIEVSATVDKTSYTGIAGSNIVGTGTGATFNITVAGTSYTTVKIKTAGKGYAVGDSIKISGSLLGAASGTTVNDLTISITTVDLAKGGTITGVNSSGTAAGHYIAATLRLADGSNTLFDPTIHTSNDPNFKFYKEDDILWTTRKPKNLIIKGVGQSNGSSGGGGGAGGGAAQPITVSSGTELTIVVGDGGKGGIGQIDVSAGSAGSAGGASSITGSGVSVSVSGGSPGASFTSGAAAGGSGGTGFSETGSAGLPGKLNARTSVTTSVGGAGGTNTSAYGSGGVGGSLIETAQDTIFDLGSNGRPGYVSISWRA